MLRLGYSCLAPLCIQDIVFKIFVQIFYSIYCFYGIVHHTIDALHSNFVFKILCSRYCKTYCIQDIVFTVLYIIKQMHTKAGIFMFRARLYSRYCTIYCKIYCIQGIVFTVLYIIKQMHSKARWDIHVQPPFVFKILNKISKHLKGHLAPSVSDVTFLDQRVIPGSL